MRVLEILPKTIEIPLKYKLLQMNKFIKPLAMTDDEVGEALLQMAHAITTKDQAITTQANREVLPLANRIPSSE